VNILRTVEWVYQSSRCGWRRKWWSCRCLDS